MAKFRFRFETIEKLRKQIEELALKVLSEKQALLLYEIENKSKLVNQLNRSLQRREDLGKYATPKDLFQLENNYILGTKKRISDTQRRILKAEKEVQKAQDTFINARRRREAISKIKERDAHLFKRALSLKELKEMDDINLMRHRLRRAER